MDSSRYQVFFISAYFIQHDVLFFFFSIYFWLHWVFFAVCGLSLVAVSADFSLAVVHGLLISVTSLIVEPGLKV